MFFGLTMMGEGGKKREKPPEEIITSFINEILNDKVGDKGDLNRILEYLKSLPKTDQKDDLLGIEFSISTTPSKKGRKRGEGDVLVFQVVIDGGSYSLIPKNSLEQGFRLLDEVNKE